MGARYVVAIKPSARRVNESAGLWVGGHGPIREFADREAARDWAEEIRDGGPVRIQNAAPNDPAPVDGYLVADPARRRDGERDEERAATESAELDAYATDG